MKSAIVTGSSSGIGAATAVELAARGYAVGITYSENRGGAEETAQRVKSEGLPAAVAQLDLSDPETAREVVHGLAAELGGGLSILVNCAGFSPRTPSISTSVEDFYTALAVNLVGPAMCAQAAARLMIAAKTPGRIIHVTSVLASAPCTGAAAYCTAKAGLEMLTKVSALEWAEHGISVIAVAPGHTATPMNRVRELNEDTDLTRPVIPLGRAAWPAEIAGEIAHLATDATPYLTGSTVTVDGGLLLRSGPNALFEATGS